MRTLILPAVALLAVAIANIDVHPTKTVTRTVEVPVEQIVTKRVEVPVRELRDGYISRKDCVQIEQGDKLEDVITRYGWPEGGDPSESYFDNYMNITLREDHTSFCSIDFYENEVSRVQVL